MKSQETALSNKALALFMCVALVFSLMIPGFAYADPASVDGQQTVVEGQPPSDDPSGIAADEDTTLSSGGSLSLSTPGSEAVVQGTALSFQEAAVEENSAMVAAAPVSGNAVVNGEQGFDTVQAALNAVTSAVVSEPTSYTVEVKAGSYSEALSFYQQANKNVVLKAADGSRVVFTNSLSIDGSGRYYEPETFKVQGIIFDFSGKTAAADCISSSNMVMPGSTGTDHYSYLHNITIQDCTFLGNGWNGDIVGVRVSSGRSGEGNNFAINNCTTGGGMHSLAQFVGGTRGNLTFTGNTVRETKGGINLFGSGQQVTFADNNFDVNTYALRFGSGSGSLEASSSVNITDSVLHTKDATDGSIIFRGTAPETVSISNSEIINNNANGFVLQNTVAGNAARFAFNLSGIYWGPQGFVPSRVAGFSPNASLTKEGSSYIARLGFDANGGTFAGGSLAQGSARVTFAADGSTRTTVSLPIAPTNGDKVLLGWFTDPASGNEIVSGTNANLVADATLYAHWGSVEQQVAVVENRLDAINEDSSEEDIDAAVSALTHASPETIASIVNSSEGEKVIQQIAQLEEAYLKVNEGKIEATKPSISEEVKSVVKEAKVDGAALSVTEYVAGFQDMALYAQVDILPVATPELPPSINASIAPISLDITLNVLAGDNVIASHIQPKAPLTLTITVDDPDRAFDLDKLVIVHYHEGDAPQIITPSKATREGGTLEVTFTLTKLSSVVIAQRDTGSGSSVITGGGEPTGSGAASSGTALSPSASSNVPAEQGLPNRVLNITELSTCSPNADSGVTLDTGGFANSGPAGSALPIVLIVAALVAVAAVIGGRKLLASPSAN